MSDGNLTEDLSCQVSTATLARQMRLIFHLRHEAHTAAYRTCIITH